MITRTTASKSHWPRTERSESLVRDRPTTSAAIATSRSRLFVGLAWRAVRLAVAVSRDTSYVGEWRISILVTRLRHAVTLFLTQNLFIGAREAMPYPDDQYERSWRGSTSDLAEDDHVVDALVGGLNRTLNEGRFDTRLGGSGPLGQSESTRPEPGKNPALMYPRRGAELGGRVENSIFTPGGGTLSEAIDRRHSSMDRPQVVVEQLDVPARDLERRRAVAEDPLEGEDVAAVRKEGSREGVAEDVRRASRRDASRDGEAADELLDRPRSQATASSADEERIRIARRADE